MAKQNTKKDLCQGKSSACYEQIRHLFKVNWGWGGWTEDNNKSKKE